MDRPRWIVAGFAALACLLYCGKAYHIDEPAYLAIAGQILRDPFHPLSFDYNWFGFSTPMWVVNAFPTLFPYLLAPALALTGGAEWLMRLAFLPFDLLAALSLYALAARLLRRPLVPTLIILAGPAYLINMGHLMPDKLVAAFGLAGLACFLKALDEDRPAFFPWAGVLLAGALLCKFTAVFALLAVLGAGWGRRPARWLAWFCVLTAAPLLAALAAAYLRGGAWGGVAGSAWRGVSVGLAMSGGGFFDRLRALLAFTGGCGFVTMAWPLLDRSWRRRGLVLLAAAAAVAVLFLPSLDRSAVVPHERLLGAVFSFGALASLSIFVPLPARGHRHGRLLAAWAAAVLVLQLFFYWSIVTRYVAFLIIPIVLAQAAALEARLETRALRRTYAVGLGLTLVLSLALARVDYRYAAAQKEIAALVAEQARGRRLWFTGHWGFQYYMEKAGAAPLDALAGGWGVLRPGDIAVVPTVNTLVLPPPGPAPGLVLPCPEPVPLRLMGRGGAGFYSSNFGFLPYSVDGSPLDSFRILVR
ncbi:MAG: glycosyltransferase family 39 protein [Elusimicrobia bacterium]|nr:glycosyltransferase family 39 protein [Elusimicrobiota bacterium]